MLIKTPDRLRQAFFILAIWYQAGHPLIYIKQQNQPYIRNFNNIYTL